MNYLWDTLTASNLSDSFVNGWGYIPHNPNGRQFLTTISSSGVVLSNSFVADIATNNGGIILVEAWTNTTQPLVLTIYHGTNQIAQTSLTLSISEVEQMFRYKNLLLYPDPYQQADRLTDESVPNEPPTGDANVVFVHGYNVNPNQARGWSADIYKRLYWSGSHAKFYGVAWSGYDTQGHLSPSDVTPNYETNVIHAFPNRAITGELPFHSYQ